MEDLMKAFIIKTDERLETHGAAIRNLERQVAQIASLLSEKTPRTLPADTERNLKETINAVSLRNGKVLQDPLVTEKNAFRGNQVQNEVRAEQNDDLKEKNKSEVPTRKKKDKQRMNEDTEERKYMPVLPFPQKQRREKLDKQFGRFLEVLKQVYVNIPFTELLSHMLAYDKFLKDILSKKRKVEDTSVVRLTEHCSAILQNKLPQKCEDPRSFAIPCSLGTIKFKTTLCDLGIVEDVLVRVDKFVFPVDFIMVNMEKNMEIPMGGYGQSNSGYSGKVTHAQSGGKKG
ncbi:uncharacterized protein [Nicotiana tomentosiformis]|uniref:uncharacterized protein n=1 Tax=Nicotiana tomentosiformis TaxID=4098 RepID=UPI00051B9362|nr:uncharacterized protein LOC104116501 [Nicotiana tomentosiformis]